MIWFKVPLSCFNPNPYTLAPCNLYTLNSSSSICLPRCSSQTFSHTLSLSCYKFILKMTVKFVSFFFIIIAYTKRNNAMLNFPSSSYWQQRLKVLTLNCIIFTFPRYSHTQNALFWWHGPVTIPSNPSLHQLKDTSQTRAHFALGDRHAGIWFLY